MRRRLFLLLLACVSLGIASVLYAQSTPNVAPAPTPVCPNAPASRLIVRERARVATGDPRPLNMREGAGTAFDRIAQIPANGVFYVLEGPECSQLYAWYRVDFNGVEGWIAEGDMTAYYVEIYPPGT